MAEIIKKILIDNYINGVEKMNCAIIVLNYYNYNLTEECVNNILKLELNYRVIVVDNKSPNNSYEILKKKYYSHDLVEVIQTTENKGYAYGNNYGIRYILSHDKNIKYICVMNPDVVVKDKLVFDSLINTLDKNSDLAIVSAVMILNGIVNYENGWWNIPSKSELIRDHVRFLKKRKGVKKIEYRDGNIGIVEVVPGSFFIIKSDILKEIDYLDEDTFLYNEENILAIKLKKKNYKEAIILDKFYFHNHNPSIRKKTLKEKYEVNKISYESRKVLCDKYYNKKYLSMKLQLIHGINCLEIAIKHLVKKIISL